MRIIHCTQKMLKELKVTNPAPAPDILPNSNQAGLGNWYANLLRIERRKCILFTNEKSMYSFLVPGVKAPDFKEFKTTFIVHLCLNLQAEGFSREVIGRVRGEYQEIAYAKTKDRRVLGFMNDFAFHFEAHAQAVEGIDNIRLMEINHRINRTPCNASTPRNCFRPIEAMRKMVEEME
jgi:hypothetical protein